MWLRRYWDEDIVGCYRGGAIHHRPADQDYDLHFNLPSSALQVHNTQIACPCVGVAAEGDGLFGPASRHRAAHATPADRVCDSMIASDKLPYLRDSG